jgi:ubiquinone/menaquinone biosynthesis C-methylase UbiE
MEFTGERYVPSLEGQIKYEHLHRYALCLEFVGGKDVLDIASGEGYGAALLASIAKSVTGVDIDPASVEHARHVYYSPKLNFVAGNCDSVPLPDASFDVVTSFETIEHHDKHEEMLDEIKRLLRPGGTLIMSSPNRLTYSDEPSYKNPFHVKELYFDEFYELLQRRFKSIRMFGQRLAAGSFVFPVDTLDAPNLKPLQ